MTTTGSNNYSLKWNDYEVTMQTEFKRLFTSQELADLKLVADDKEFFVHKVVMAMGSDFLQQVLLDSCCCGNEGITEMILPGLKSKELEKILAFIYMGQVNVEEGEMGGFFEVAKQLGIKGLVEHKTNANNSILVKALLAGNDVEMMDGLDGIGGVKEESTSTSSFENYSENSLESPPSQSTNIPTRATTSNSIINSRIRATDPRPCPKCGKIYRSAHTLRTHLEDKHTSCPGYRCVLCGTVAKSRNSLHSHMSRQHRGISTKDLPVLPMPAPFDPQLAARLLGETFGQNNGGGGNGLSGGGRTSGEESTGSAILDTYLQFIAENTSLFSRKGE